MSDELREWTVMVYFASDNDLTRSAVDNKIELFLTGSSDQVQVFLQLDPEDPSQSAFRDRVTPNLGFDSKVQLKLEPDPGTGRVESLVDFVKWVKQNGGDNAKKYLLVLWGHADGVDDDEDDEQSVASSIVTNVTPNGGATAHEVTGAGEVAVEVEVVAINTPAESLVVHSGTVSVDEGFGVDFHPNLDALTCSELKEAVKSIATVLGQKIDLLGFDACLMGMVEIAQQVSDSASVLVASEHTIPDRSWPYGKIMKRLLAQPAMTPQDLAGIIVDEYVTLNQVSCAQKFCDSEPVQLSAFDLTKTDLLAGRIRKLGEVLTECLPKRRFRQAIVKARRMTQTYLISDYIDLFHFCLNLDDVLISPAYKAACVADSATCKNIRDACEGVMQAIKPKDVEGFVLTSKVNAKPHHPLANSHGVSIYFPLILPLYRNLEICKTTRWDSFLSSYAATVFLPTGVSEILSSNPTTLGENSMAEPTLTKTIAFLEGCTVILPDLTVMTLTGFATLDMEPNPEVSVPPGTDLHLPQSGHKASTGTETKALTAGSRVGSPENVPPPGVEMVIPAAVLTEFANGAKTTELPAGTIIKTAPGAAPLMVLADLLVK